MDNSEESLKNTRPHLLNYESFSLHNNGVCTFFMKVTDACDNTDSV